MNSTGKPAFLLLEPSPEFARLAAQRAHLLDLSSVPAEQYAEQLASLDCHDVTVIGTQAGGPAAAELALLGSPHISGLILIDPADDPELRARLEPVTIPVLVLSSTGDSASQAYAASMPHAAIGGAVLRPLPGAGPEDLLDAIWNAGD
jgi:pimeloyl-ACP methyl ester carboxylesterase